MNSLLIIGSVWPEPKSSAAGSRMLQLISLFQGNGWEVTYACAAQHSEYAVHLDDYNVKVEAIQLNDSSFDEWVERLSPKAVLFDRYMTEEQYGARIHEKCPNTLLLLDSEDLHFLRNERYLALKQQSNFKVENLLLNEMAKREIASMYRCDLTLVISKAEMKILKEVFKFPEALLIYVPFLLNEKDVELENDVTPFENRSHFLAIGNFLHQPNWDATLYLKNEIWPLIRKELPKAELRICGAYPSQKVMQLHNEKEGFNVVGRVEDALQEMKRSKVLLAPLRFGAGLKGKLIEAMQVGLPSVTTSIGAEGIGVDDNWPGFIKEQPQQFAEAAVLLCTNSKKWKRASELGSLLLRDEFLDQPYSNLLMERVDELLVILEKHRQLNFVGAMLKYHHLKSTYYMSKWIEAKNKVS